METLIVHPENKEQLSAVKAFLKALKISFEKKELENYNPEFVKMILDAKKRGNYTTIDPKDIWGSLGLK